MTGRSWGGYPRTTSTDRWVDWSSDPLPLRSGDPVALPHGCGRSYGDVCLNEGGLLLRTRRLDRFLDFDEERGILRCEAGATLGEVLDLVTPKGWILPVVPGTQHVTVGGAIANDVHGKNHVSRGTFGCHVLEFELLRSDGERLICRPNDRFFEATIGGLGLTGLVARATLRLDRLPSFGMDVTSTPFEDLEEFRSLVSAAPTNSHVVAWVDTASHPGRGILDQATFAADATAPAKAPRHYRMPRFSMGLQQPAVHRVLSRLHFRKHASKRSSRVDVRSVLFPLDRIEDWNRAYGRHGFLQWQAVIPDEESMRQTIHMLGDSRVSGFLGALKVFGPRKSPGMLSFPRPGTTLAIDLPIVRGKTFPLLDGLDRIVTRAGGAIYPAKDARMSGETFRAGFPRWKEFAETIDPAFSSSLWRRLMA